MDQPIIHFYYNDNLVFNTQLAPGLVLKDYQTRYDIYSRDGMIPDELWPAICNNYILHTLLAPDNVLSNNPPENP